MKRIGPVSIGLTFEVEPGNDATDDLGRTYRPKQVTITVSSWIKVEIAAVKAKKDGSDSLTSIDPYHYQDNYPDFVRAAIVATQEYAMKAQEANA